MRHLVLSMMLAALAGCGGEEAPVTSADETSEASESGSDREHAIEVARTLAQSGGTDLSRYRLESAELANGRWTVTFTLPPPTPPGGFFAVIVDPTTWEGELMPGE